MPIEGKAKRLYRRDITTAIAEALGIDAPAVPKGSTVGTAFLDAVVTRLGGHPATLANTYRKIEFALETCGEAYDPSHDSSEHVGALGGGTVTNGGYRKLLRGVTKQPQCFILNIADHPVSDQYADVPGESYGFDDDVSGRVPFLEAGPGSRVIFYRTRKATELPKRAFIGHAIVTQVGPTDGENYRASLSEYQEFDHPVLANDVAVDNWNPQHGIVEIDYQTLAALVSAGTGAEVPPTPAASPKAPPTAPIDSPVPPDVTDDTAAKKLLESLPDVDAPVDLSSAQTMPDSLPRLEAEPSPEVAVTLPHDGDAADETSDEQRKRGARKQRLLDRYAEQRAVHVARVYLARQGWKLHRDCQKLGIGYDLEYRKEGSVRHVEVKGIQGGRLIFNLTALEWARVLEDPNFVVIAVTGLLHPADMKIHVVARDRLAAAARKATQYRIDVT